MMDVTGFAGEGDSENATGPGSGTSTAPASIAAPDYSNDNTAKGAKANPNYSWSDKGGESVAAPAEAPSSAPAPSESKSNAADGGTPATPSMYGPGGSYTTPQLPMACQTKVYIGYRALGQDPISGKTYHHTFVAIVSPANELFVIRGGPSQQAQNQFAGLFSDLAGTNPSGGGAFGDLTITEGAEAANLELRDGANLQYQLALTTDLSFSKVVSILSEFGNDLDSADIAYGPVSENCNAFTFQAVSLLRNGNRPSQMYMAPGYNTVLRTGKK